MSLFLEKGFGMYSNSHPARYLSAPTLRGQYVPACYGDFGDYHHHQLAEFGDLLGSPPAAAWSVAHAAPREEWSTFGLPGSSPGAGGGGASHYETPEWTALHPASFGGGSCPSLTGGPGDRSPYSLTSKCAWTRDCAHPASGDVAEHHSVPTAEDPHLSGARTRTKDKYRVVYSDHQRLELEKEFQHNRYINVGKKSQLSLELRLSERQVKIWFQNRRAKERKLMRRKATAAPPSPGAARSDPSQISPPAPPVDC